MSRLTQVRLIAVPPGSDIGRYLADSDYHDTYAIPIRETSRSALEFYLDMVTLTPRWVEGLMRIRNRAVTWFGLKNLGPLDGLPPGARGKAWAVGDRVGIFSIMSLSDDEVVLGDCDKHLDVRVSVLKSTSARRPAVAVTTVVHVHNRLGRVYMWLVRPFHRRIVPAMLARCGA